MSTTPHHTQTSQNLRNDQQYYNGNQENRVNIAPGFRQPQQQRYSNNEQQRYNNNNLAGYRVNSDQQVLQQGGRLMQLFSTVNTINDVTSSVNWRTKKEGTNGDFSNLYNAIFDKINALYDLYKHAQDLSTEEEQAFEFVTRIYHELCFSYNQRQSYETIYRILKLKAIVSLSNVANSIHQREQTPPQVVQHPQVIQHVPVPEQNAKAVSDCVSIAKHGLSILEKDKPELGDPIAREALYQTFKYSLEIVAGLTEKGHFVKAANDIAFRIETLTKAFKKYGNSSEIIILDKIITNIVKVLREAGTSGNETVCMVTIIEFVESIKSIDSDGKRISLGFILYLYTNFERMVTVPRGERRIGVSMSPSQAPLNNRPVQGEPVPLDVFTCDGFDSRFLYKLRSDLESHLKKVDISLKEASRSSTRKENVNNRQSFAGYEGYLKEKVLYLYKFLSGSAYDAIIERLKTGDKKYCDWHFRFVQVSHSIRDSIGSNDKKIDLNFVAEQVSGPLNEVLNQINGALAAKEYLCGFDKDNTPMDCAKKVSKNLEHTLKRFTDQKIYSRDGFIGGEGLRPVPVNQIYMVNEQLEAAQQCLESVIEIERGKSINDEAQSAMHKADLEIVRLLLTLIDYCCQQLRNQNSISRSVDIITLIANVSAIFADPEYPITNENGTRIDQFVDVDRVSDLLVVNGIIGPKERLALNLDQYAEMKFLRKELGKLRIVKKTRDIWKAVTQSKADIVLDAACYFAGEVFGSGAIPILMGVLMGVDIKNSTHMLCPRSNLYSDADVAGAARNTQMPLADRVKTIYRKITHIYICLEDGIFYNQYGGSTQSVPARVARLNISAFIYAVFGVDLSVLNSNPDGNCAIHSMLPHVSTGKGIPTQLGIDNMFDVEHQYVSHTNHARFRVEFVRFFEGKYTSYVKDTGGKLVAAEQNKIPLPKHMYDDVVRYKHAGAYVSTDSLPYFADFLKRPIINIERTTHNVFTASFSVPGLSELGGINDQTRHRDQIHLSFNVGTGSFDIDQAGSVSAEPEISKFASIASNMGYLPNGVDEKLAVKILRDKNHGDRNRLLFHIMRRVFTDEKAIHITMPLKLKKLPLYESEQHFQTLLPNNKLPTTVKTKKKTEWR